MAMRRPAQPGQSHTYEVVFVRHGQSTWNKANRFIGWTDAELTEAGEVEARVAGQVKLNSHWRSSQVRSSLYLHRSPHAIARASRRRG